MAEQGFKRKLAAILSADVEGYSRLMRHDEIATIETLKSCRNIMSNLIQQHNGCVVDTPGDNLLAEFDSVVSAVECAVEIQEEFKTRNAELSENRKMKYRIGVNLGEVVVDSDRIYGTGVNIAARLEKLAKGGGICISRNVYDQVRNQIELGYEYIGEQSVKNISEPIYVYRVLVEHEDSMFPFDEKQKLEQSEKPSIAILPFDNMSGDSSQDYFCDGITEEIITGLCNIPLLFVIARNSSAVYKGKSVNVQQVGQELGVQYVMEGSVRKFGERIRITAQLIDAVTGHHLWADRYDNVIDDLFALQDEITVKILSALQLKLEHGHRANIWIGATKNLTALEKNYQGTVELWNHGNFTVARKLCEEAIELDPEFSPPYVTLGWCHMTDFWLGISESPNKSLKKAFDLAQKALSLNDANAPAYSLLGKITYTMGEHKKGIELGRRAVALNPNEADCHAHLGCILTYCGHPEEALYWINKAFQLNPILPWLYYLYFGQAYNMLGRYEEAIRAYKKTLELLPGVPFALIGIAQGYSLLGKYEEARSVAEEAYRVFPIFSTEYHVKSYAYIHQADTDRFLKALRDAGLK
jgi:adenylate cyclase